MPPYSSTKPKQKKRLNLPAVDTGPYFETQHEDHRRDKEKVQAAAEHRGHGAHPCSRLVVEANGFGRHAALHGEREVHTDAKLLLQVPVIGALSDTDAIDMDEARSDTKRTRPGERVNRFPGGWREF